MFEKKVLDTILTACVGDITQQRVDVIVNAANSTLLGGGGVDGAIHLAGGPSILAECKKIAEAFGPCLAGNAVITGAGALPAKWVVHAVGPIWAGGTSDEHVLLRRCYSRSLELAAAKGAASIAFPAISAGAYRFPLRAAAEVAIEACIEGARRYRGTLTEIRFVLFSDGAFAVYHEILSAIRQEVEDDTATTF